MLSPFLSKYLLSRKKDNNGLEGSQMRLKNRRKYITDVWATWTEVGISTQSLMDYKKDLYLQRRATFRKSWKNTVTAMTGPNVKTRNTGLDVSTFYYKRQGYPWRIFKQGYHFWKWCQEISLMVVHHVNQSKAHKNQGTHKNEK